MCRIPWTGRKEHGRFRTFWQTVWMVTFRNREYCEEYAHELTCSDARVFQWVTVLHVFLAVLFTTAYVYMTVPPLPEVGNPLQQMMTSGIVQPGPTFIDRAYAEVWPVGVLHVCFFLFLLTATEAPSYFFHPRSIPLQQQSNAVTMSYYACGPLAFAPALLLIAPAVAFVSLDWWFGSVCGLAGSVLIVAWWWNLLCIVRRTMPPLRLRAAALAFCLPILWFVLGFVFLGLLPLVLLYIFMFFVSLGA